MNDLDGRMQTLITNISQRIRQVYQKAEGFIEDEREFPLSQVFLNATFQRFVTDNVKMLQDGLKARGFDLGGTNTCVTPVFMYGEVEEALKLIYDLRENYDIFCSIVVYPVIPKGMMLLRLIPTAAHTAEDIEITLKAFGEVADKLKAGAYAPAVEA